ncbi:GNAT family N-acetyltransferase [Streptomyces sp. NEAU-H3]|uniref:GNAT family N-acetyltransferase n=1 Tax=Streptomyces sp. NEAU-H3 TaxID=2720636 RepID=UPI00143AF703|nr:GNAT family N-acetyltransferase [Streptomyces sp. NEAU-H3]NJA60466.1 GNAT family N-acetyltransferase [Streptomyces sp. NEAU-H3]
MSAARGTVAAGPVAAGPVIRGLAPADWAAIISLEAAAYAPLGLSESPAVLRAKAAVSPGTCFVARTGAETVGGYLLALPSPPRRPPSWGRTEPAPALRENLHVHDLVVSPLLRGRGLGRRLVAHVEDAARDRGCTSVSLVAVGGADRFWAALGYVAQPDVAVTDYGASAVYMSRSLASREPSPGRSASPAHQPSHRRS